MAEALAFMHAYLLGFVCFCVCVCVFVCLCVREVHLPFGTLFWSGGDCGGGGGGGGGGGDGGADDDDMGSL